MSSIVSKKLSIDENNIEQYCDAQNVAFNVSGHAWRKWLNGSSDGYVILKNEGKAVIYPTDTAHPFKADSVISASRSAGSCTVELLVGGTSVHSESYTSGSQTQKSKSGITDAAIANSTKATEIKWHVNGANGNNQRGDLLELTLYFYQYTMSANIGNDANGIQSVNVSDATPYYGDSVTFNTVLVKGSTWHGWYSDAACTTLVSSDQSYTVSPSADLTLYAKAVNESTLYNCSAVAGAEISSVSVSDAIVPEGETSVFTAQVNTDCSFEAWYSDNTYTAVVSTENPYTATIMADITLYAKAYRNELHMSVGAAEHGTATVNAATVPYGSDATFTFTPEDETWELYGWYSDSGLTQLVSEANPYSFTVTEDATLYPKVGKKKYAINVKWSNLIYFLATTVKIVSADTTKFSRVDWERFRSGAYDEINPDAVIEIAIENAGKYASDNSVTLNAPIDSTVSMYANHSENDGSAVISLFTENSRTISSGNVYIFNVDGSRTFGLKQASVCICASISGTGIDYSYAFPQKAAQGSYVEFCAELETDYVFRGWYSDEECTNLVSSNNPAKVTATTNTSGDGTAATLTLYAKATKIGATSTGISLKLNNTWVEAKTIYKKVDGAWVLQDNPKALFSGSSTGNESNYIYCGEISS